MPAIFAADPDDERGLAISDFWMAVNFMSSASMNLTGNNIGDKEEKHFCNFNGFMIQVFVVQSMLHTYLLFTPFDFFIADYWILTIAVCTYLILADHKHQSSWIQDHRIIIWILPWLLSILWAAIGLAVVGYGDIGACKFMNTTILDQLFISKELCFKHP